MSANTADILSTLRHIADGPLETATALPPALYTSPEILERENTQIFAKDWTCAGLAAEIPEPGDYLTWSIGKQLVFTIRDSSGEIRTFANVCRHRMMQLVTGKGNCKRVVCPYHAWTYNLKGQLIGAPHMERSAGFEKTSIALPEIRTEIWQGWIYVTLDDNAKPVVELLNPLEQIISRYRMAGYVPVVQQDHVWQTNWKFLVENFMEGYHLPVAHKNTVGAWMPIGSVEFSESYFPAFTYQTFIKEGDATYGGAHADNKILEGKWRSTTAMPTVFPTHMYVLAPDHLWYLSLRPKGVGQVDVKFGVALAPEVHAAMADQERETFVNELSEFFDQVNTEDRFVVEGIFKGAQAPLTEPGQLSWLERELHEFAQYLARRLCNDAANEIGRAAE